MDRKAANDNHDILGLRPAVRSMLLDHGIDPDRDPFAMDLEWFVEIMKNSAFGTSVREVAGNNPLAADAAASSAAFFIDTIQPWIAKEAARRRQSPRNASALLSILAPRSHRAAIVGDLDEVFERNVAAFGWRSARRAYWRDALRSTPPLVLMCLSRVLASIIASTTGERQ